MAKKTKAELVAEGKALKPLLAAMKQKPHNFALLIGTEDLFLELDKRKAPSALKRIAKTAGGGNKGATGEASVKENILVLQCEEGVVPPPKLGRMFKKYLRERGLRIKVAIVSHTGEMLEADEEDTATPEQPADTSAPDTGIEAKLQKAYKKIGPALVAAVKASPPDYANKLKLLNAGFTKAMSDQDFEKALQVLAALRKAVAAAPTEDRLTAALASKGDPAKLADMKGLIDNIVDRASKDTAFDDKIKPQIKDLRRAMKAALATPPPDPAGAELEKLKKQLDEVCLNYLAKEGHGPQRHEGAVTPKQLSDRVLLGHDPVTGTPFDAYKKIKKGKKKGQPAKHSCAQHATRLKDPGDYVDADETVRGGTEFANKRAASVKAKSNFVKVEIPLEEALGTGYETKLEGFTRKGTKAKPTGTEPTNFTGGKLVALYIIQPDGSEKLLTMYPDPTPIPKKKGK